MDKNEKFRTFRGYEILGKEKEILSHSMEDYLEMIYRTSLVEGHARISTLAESLNVQTPSATKMVQKLAKLGLLKYEKYGIVELTKEGEEIGKFLLRRHETIERFLRNIGVEEDLLINVELMEHNLTTGALKKIEILNDFFQTYPEIYEKYRKHRDTSQNC